MAVGALAGRAWREIVSWDGVCAPEQNAVSDRVYKGE